jgi:hypothetical protein
LKLLLPYILFLAVGPVPAPPHAPAVDKVLNLFQALDAAQKKGPKAAGHLRFQFSEAEINEYLAYASQAQPRPGIVSVTLKFFPRNYVSSYTVVDFNEVERWKPGTVPAALRPVLKGKKAIWVDIRFAVRNGAMTFRVEKAYFEKVPLPDFLAEKVIQVVAARQPEKYDTSKPMPLPWGVRKAWTSLGTAGGEN